MWDLRTAEYALSPNEHNSLGVRAREPRVGVQTTNFMKLYKCMALLNCIHKLYWTCVCILQFSPEHVRPGEFSTIEIDNPINVQSTYPNRRYSKSRRGTLERQGWRSAASNHNLSLHHSTCMEENKYDYMRTWIYGMGTELRASKVCKNSLTF